jgi:ribosomal RNA-processing protein 9
MCLVNDDHFLSGTNDGALSLWHISKKKPLFTAYKAHQDEKMNTTWITAVAALHNTDLIASGMISF